MGSPFLAIPDAIGGAERALEQRFGLSTGELAAFFGGPRNVPATRTRLSHAYSLKTATGRTIGGVFRASVQQSRDVEDEFEVDLDAHGEPADQVPQALSQRSFEIARYDLYTEVMEEVFGTREFEILTDQAVGIKLREVWRAPTGFLGSQGRQYEFLVCHFERLGRAVDTVGDRVVSVDASLRWLRRRRVS